MTNLKLNLSLMLIIGFSTHLISQSNITITHATSGYGEDYRYVYDITQDDYGFMWLANHTGLRRYDGIDFQTYQHSKENPNSLSINTILRVTKDSQNNIWAYGDDGVFNKLNLLTDSVTRINTFFKEGKAKSKSPILTHFKSLGNGEFVALCYEESSYSDDVIYSLWRYNSQLDRFDFQIEISTAGKQISHFTEREDGRLWLWGLNQGYYLIDLENIKALHKTIPNKGLNTSEINKAPIDNNRNFWYPTSSLSNNDNDLLTSFKVPETIDISKINRLNIDNKDDIWFYHDNDDLFKFNSETKSLEHFADPVFNQANGAQLMYHIFVDDNGDYWNGHFLGAIQFNKEKALFNKYLYHPRIENELNTKSFSARDMLEVPPNKILVKENKQEFFLIDLKTKKESSFSWETYTKNEDYYSMVLGKDGYLWVNTIDKIIRVSISSGASKVYPIKIDKYDADLREESLKKFWPMLFEDNSGQLWWSDLNGVFKFNKSNGEITKIQLDPPPGKIRGDFKYGNFNETSNTIYGTYKNGLYLVDCASETTSLIPLFSDSEGYDILITNILFWKNDIWLSTNKGLLHYHTETKEKYWFKRRNGLPSNLVFSALGSQDHLWLATYNGLCQFDPYENQMTNFYMEHGLSSNNFNIKSFLQTQSGDFYFGGTNGIIGFNPNDFKICIKQNDSFNWVAISKYDRIKNVTSYVNNPSYDNPEKLIVKANERALTFKYSLAHYKNLSDNNYSHFMEGLDQDWVNDGPKNEAKYLSVPPGNYTFRVRASRSNNLCEISELVIPIIVKPYWYLSWWAILGYILLLAYSVFKLNKYLLNRQFRTQETKRIKELDTFKTKMYTNITHEFRTPLTVLLGMNDAIKDYTVDGETDKVFHANKMIDRNGKNLLNLVNQMLEMSKLESGELMINNQQGNIVDYLKYRLESFQSYASDKGIRILFHPEKENIVMDYDIDKWSYIVGNLISNAIKFTPKNGQVDVYLKQLNNDAEQKLISLEVIDTGIGMEADQANKIFDRFYRADNVDATQGTGIGLSLVKELVNLLRGSIEVNSEINKGTHFIVNLPITNNADIITKEDTATSEEWSAHIKKETMNADDYLNDDEQKPLVLVVEDNDDVSHYISVSIKEKFRVVRATNGRQGIDKALTLIPDIIISDVMMPVMDGYELCNSLKNDERTSHIPIVLLTGKADIDSKIQGLEHGADVYLAKPFNRKELLIRLKNLLVLRAEIQNLFSNSTLGQPINGFTKTENSFIAKAQTAILENMVDEEFSVTQLSKVIHISRTQLHRKLIALTGKSTSHLIKKTRLERAKELLLLGELNVSEVAYQVGFKTQAHFSRLFSEFYGRPPSHFLKK